MIMPGVMRPVLRPEVLLTACLVLLCGLLAANAVLFAASTRQMSEAVDQHDAMERLALHIKEMCRGGALALPAAPESH